MIAIVDYGVSNIGSLLRVFQRLGIAAQGTSDPTRIGLAEGVVLPGVGSFEKGMANIRERNLEQVLKQRALGDRVPFLGVCLGMQLMTTCSEEDVSGKVTGLNLIRGRTLRLMPPEGEGVRKFRIPHMGWNDVVPVQQSNHLFHGLRDSRFYFAHSYFVQPESSDHVMAETDYGRTFASAICASNLFGVQFHPEKSHRYGFSLIDNFIKRVRDA